MQGIDQSRYYKLELRKPGPKYSVAFEIRLSIYLFRVGKKFPTIDESLLRLTYSPNERVCDSA